jgi:hypothetical protein
MKYKPFILPLMAALSIVAAFSVLQFGIRAQANEKGEKSEPEKSLQIEQIDSTKHSRQIIAYYFHGNVRCATCRKIEAYTKEAIDSAFAKELKSGLLEFHATNIDSSKNEHFIDDYELYTKSVIVADFVNGKQVRWKNLEKIWTLTGNKAEFAKYIQIEVKAFLDTTQ